MAEYDNTNSGAIFVNNRKESANHPDRTGTINVAGVDYWLSGWLKTDKNGKQFMSLSVKPKDAQPARSPNDRGEPHIDDDIPF